jgi:hypothetical protein
MRLEGLGKFKNPITSTELEPAESSHSLCGERGFLPIRTELEPGLGNLPCAIRPQLSHPTSLSLRQFIFARALVPLGGRGVEVS